MQIEKEEIRPDAKVTALIERWLLGKLSDTIAEVTDAMEHFQFDRALKTIREFAWEVLADEYIELVKGRLYLGGADRESACLTLRTTFDSLCRMLAPFTPYFAEECYSYLSPISVHKQEWTKFTYADEEALREGELLVTVVSELRRYKHEQGMALNAPLGKVTIYSAHSIDDAGDASRTLNAEVHWSKNRADLEQVVSDVQFNLGVIGPALRKQAKGFMEAVRALPKDQLINPPSMVLVNGEEIPVPAGAFSPKFSYMVGGEKVDVVNVGDVIVTVQRPT
jgi:valyl-tRNA synthetase